MYSLNAERQTERDRDGERDRTRIVYYTSDIDHYEEKMWEDAMQSSKQNKTYSIKNKHGISVSVFAKAAR